jgi:hypothetical protein
MDIKYTKWSENWPKGHKNIPTSSIARPTKIYPNWDFGFGMKPSGNPFDITLQFSAPFTSFAWRKFFPFRSGYEPTKFSFVQSWLPNVLLHSNFFLAVHIKTIKVVVTILLPLNKVTDESDQIFIIKGFRDRKVFGKASKRTCQNFFFRGKNL